jgi:hypothetical protein
MTISVNTSTKVISIPQADLTLVGGSLYELDTDWLWEQIKAWEATEVGMAYPDAQRRAPATTIAGVTYAPLFEILPPYSIEFTPDSQYSVRLTGTNNNVFDVENGILQQNQVQVIANNSAGLISGGTISDQLDLILDWVKTTASQRIT